MYSDNIQSIKQKRVHEYKGNRDRFILFFKMILKADEEGKNTDVPQMLGFTVVTGKDGGNRV